MAGTDPRLIEPPVRLSQSKIWRIQENYFTNMGVEAWKEEVPFYISSNPFIGKQYAKLVVAFVKDYLKQHPQTRDPFYILEVGCGTGKFSFHFLKAFQALCTEENLDSQRFNYILSDVSEKNLDFCRRNPSLKPYIDAQRIDFSFFNVENSEDLHLLIQDKKFSQLSTSTPLVVIANYTLDCVTQDAFVCQNGKTQEIRLGLKSRYKDFDIQKSRHLKDLRLSFEYLDIEIENYYQNPGLNQILADYAQTFTDQEGLVMMPLGGFKFIDHLSKMTKQNFVMIVGDKGLTTTQHFTDVKSDEFVTYDGCYAFVVNFDAIGRYVVHKSGDYMLSPRNLDFNVGIFSVGFSLDNFYDLTTEFAYSTMQFGPNDYCYIYDEILTNGYRFSLKSILALWQLSENDPFVYSAIHDRLLQLVPTFNEQTKSDIDYMMQKTADNIYHLNYGENVLNYMGIFYQTMGEFSKAQPLYIKSLEIFGEKAEPHNNLGLLYEKQRNTPKALAHYEKSYALDKRNKFANRKIHALTGRPYFGALIPVAKALGIFAIITALIFYFN